MIDYRLQIVALEQFLNDFPAQFFSNGIALAERDAYAKDTVKFPDFASLGALLPNLLGHASSDGHELRLLERASSLWQRGLSVYSALGAFREALETAVADPTVPNAGTTLDEAAARFRQLASDITSVQSEIASLRHDIADFDHLPVHPRQDDASLNQWDWGNIFAARRTDAFVRKLVEGAKSPRERALALGVASSYGANVCGSTYLGRVVGGPRRLHRYRDRVARNAVGSWFARAYPQVRPLAQIANRIRFGTKQAPRLPKSIERIVANALSQTYDKKLTPPPPDIGLGYTRLMRHLELLDTFELPPEPLLPKEPFLTQLFGDPESPAQVALPPAIVEAAVGPGSGASGGVHPANAVPGQQPNGTDRTSTAGEACGGFWLGVIEFIGFIAGGWGYCVFEWVVQGDRCKLWDDMGNNFGKAFSPSPEGAAGGYDPSFGTSSSALKTLAQNDQMLLVIHTAFIAHTLLREGLGKARAYLALTGLIYPDDLLDLPVYQQFLRTATASTDWPIVADGNARHTYHRYPTGAAEQPVASAPPLVLGMTPDAILSGLRFATLPESTPTLLVRASEVAITAWERAILSTREAVNYDLDADRGHLHACWAASGSIKKQPIVVEVLKYSET
ncbi:MAG TPA: hypothetical protein VJU61_16825 [Polyangiaceae bacterium]|nr:hypothetical protein [Polyangiaceae bacterium]